MVYYLEVNLICVVILLLFWGQLRQRRATLSTDQQVLMLLIFSTVVFCLSDLVAGVFRGQMLPFARPVLEVSNLLYFEMLAVISYLWCLYVLLRTNKKKFAVSRGAWAMAAPLAAFTVAALANPVTHFLFTINQQNLYRRGMGVFLHWVLVWGYFLVPTLHLVGEYRRETHPGRRREIAPLLMFAVAPFVLSILQMAFYGITTTQVGVTISIVMICLSLQNAQVLTDALTGVNNRRAFDNYIADQIHKNSEQACSLIMIDVDHFKKINDEYGHVVGDLALQKVAEALKTACHALHGKVYLCRFGGDEFVLFGSKLSAGELQKLEETVVRELGRNSPDDKLPKDLTLSIGEADGCCTTERDYRALLKKADEAMYRAKKARHTS